MSVALALPHAHHACDNLFCGRWREEMLLNFLSLGNVGEKRKAYIHSASNSYKKKNFRVLFTVGCFLFFRKIFPSGKEGTQKNVNIQVLFLNFLMGAHRVLACCLG